MVQCWQVKPNDRPTFSLLKDKITSMMKNNNVSKLSIIFHKWSLNFSKRCIYRIEQKTKQK